MRNSYIEIVYCFVNIFRYLLHWGFFDNNKGPLIYTDFMDINQKWPSRADVQSLIHLFQDL